MVQLFDVNGPPGGIDKRLRFPTDGGASLAASAEGRAMAIGAERTMSRMPSGRRSSKN